MSSTGWRDGAGFGTNDGAGPMYTKAYKIPIVAHADGSKDSFRKNAPPHFKIDSNKSGAHSFGAGSIHESGPHAHKAAQAAAGQFTPPASAVPPSPAVDKSGPLSSPLSPTVVKAVPDTIVEEDNEGREPQQEQSSQSNNDSNVAPNPISSSPAATPSVPAVAAPSAAKKALLRRYSVDEERAALNNSPFSAATKTGTIPPPSSPCLTAIKTQPHQTLGPGASPLSARIGPKSERGANDGSIWTHSNNNGSSGKHSAASYSQMYEQQRRHGELLNERSKFSSHHQPHGYNQSHHMHNHHQQQQQYAPLSPPQANLNAHFAQYQQQALAPLSPGASMPPMHYTPNLGGTGNGGFVRRANEAEPNAVNLGTQQQQPIFHTRSRRYSAGQHQGPLSPSSQMQEQQLQHVTYNTAVPLPTLDTSGIRRHSIPAVPMGATPSTGLENHFASLSVQTNLHGHANHRSVPLSARTAYNPTPPLDAGGHASADTLVNPDAMLNPNAQSFIGGSNGTLASAHASASAHGPEYYPDGFLEEVNDYFDGNEVRSKSWVDPSRGLHSPAYQGPLYIVEFKGGRTDLYFCPDAYLKKGDLVLVDADRGKDLGKVVVDGITSPTQLLASPEIIDHTHLLSRELQPKRIYGLAQPHDVAMLVHKSQDEAKALAVCIAKARQKELPMEVVDAEYQWDRRRLTFYFVAHKRIDFRELVRELFKIYKTRIWMCAVDKSRVIPRLPRSPSDMISPLSGVSDTAQPFEVSALQQIAAEVPLPESAAATPKVEAAKENIEHRDAAAASTRTTSGNNSGYTSEDDSQDSQDVQVTI